MVMLAKFTGIFQIFYEQRSIPIGRNPAKIGAFMAPIALITMTGRSSILGAIADSVLQLHLWWLSCYSNLVQRVTKMQQTKEAQRRKL